MDSSSFKTFRLHFERQPNGVVLARLDATMAVPDGLSAVQALEQAWTSTRAQLLLEDTVRDLKLVPQSETKVSLGVNSSGITISAPLQFTATGALPSSSPAPQVARPVRLTAPAPSAPAPTPAPASPAPAPSAPASPGTSS